MASPPDANTAIGTRKKAPKDPTGSANNRSSRIKPPPHKPSDFCTVPKPATLLAAATSLDLPRSFYSYSEIPENRRGFRYTPCEATTLLPSLMYRQIELPPYRAAVNPHDSSSAALIDGDALSVSTNKGFRTARANVCVREGSWYVEFIIERAAGDNGGHVRIGWARREASLDAPVGFDGYSYGIRDVSGEKVHFSRPRPFMKPFITGDVIGMHISLPPILSQSLDSQSHPVSRERMPIRYKGQLYFEQFEYAVTKAMDDLLYPTANELKSSKPPALLGSFIRVYNNGNYVGTAFEDMFAFMPPYSQLSQSKRTLDDGMCGYFPAISVYRSGSVRFNFGPNFSHPPADLFTNDNVRPLCERYEEQIAEDIVWDVVDELCFEIEDEADMGPVAANQPVASVLTQGPSEIKEIIEDL
ncbi:Set1 complex component ash2 [Neolecta irregularis DAH-3]|uniref:Set1 complex component ash2 n=1 Tax=Neolecta irregularis (strain DAH-3) TaxID=1198029 RepID=A0A1U7LH78_NEOID|nr:Set1 complex component ash2 [Neolecta irregularis DAH-3]|eukprot:OLL21999.1 Set1 complex component ash2 [Neolecta irregularis DAH-3]